MSKDRDHLRVVPKVVKLHDGKVHLNNLVNAIMDVINDFVVRMDEQDISVTYAEVVGNLDFVKDEVKAHMRAASAMMDET